MEYTIKKLAHLAGVSTRTLRYYDEIGLLKPCRINSSGYRIYGEKEVDVLQQILFYRSMDMKLEEIFKIISNPKFDSNHALIKHHQNLVERREQLNQLILTVEKTIAFHKGEISMSNSEKFEGFKKEKLAENEAKFGKEIREKYGEETVEASNKKFLNMSEADMQKMERIEREMFDSLKVVVKTGDLESKDAKNVYEKHKEWLGFTWPSYSQKAHIGLANMYIADERFAKYYNDKAGRMATETLHKIILKFAEQGK